MPNYAPEALHKFQHKTSDKPKESPHHWYRPPYGQATQHANTKDTSLILPPKQISLVQQIIDTFLYYSLAINPTTLLDLGDMELT